MTTQRWQDTNVEWQNYNESWGLLPTIAHERQITAQLAVSRPDATFEDITEYLLSCSVELGDIDQVGTGNLGGDSTVRQFDFTLQNDREGVDGDSFHPLDKASEWNRQGGEWAPLLWPLREVVFRVAIQSQPAYEQPKGTTEQFGELVGQGDGTSQTFELEYGPVLPGSETVYVDGTETTNYTIVYGAIPSTITTDADGEITADYTYFRELFAGYLGDSIQSSEDGTTITCQARDYSKLIQDTYIDDVREYGSDDGDVLAEDVIQQILNDNMGTDAPDLYTPTSSNFAILPYELDYQSTWDAIQEVASQIGWFLGYLWDNDNLEWRLTFMTPPRDKEEGDYELTAKDDIYTADLDISDSDVRNVIEVEHRNEDEGDVQTAIVEDQDSIDEYRERRMTIGVQDAPHIDTLAEGERLAENILADLKDLSSTTRANIPIFPDADLYTAFDINDPRLTSESQFYAVETIRHDFRWGNNPQFRTEFTAGGRVIGSKHKWLRMETRPGAGKPINPEQVPDRSAAGNTVTVAAQDTSKRGRKNADYVCNGNSDQVQINSAIDSLTGGGKVVLLEGGYIVDDSIEMKSNVTLEGQGNSTEIKLVDDFDGDLDMIKEKNKQVINAVIQNLKVNGNRDNISSGVQNGIRFVDTSFESTFDIVVRDVTVTNINRNGISMGFSTVEGKISDCVVKNCERGIFIYRNCHVKSNFVEGASSFGGIILIEEGRENIIQGNTINNNDTRGIEIQALSEDIKINGNIIKGNRLQAINIKRGSKNLMISDNDIVNNRHDIPVGNGEDLSGQIELSKDASGVEENSRDIMIGNNMIRKGDDTEGGYGILVYTSPETIELLITNNDLKDSGTLGAIRDDGVDTSFGAGNRLNDGSWDTGDDA